MEMTKEQVSKAAKCFENLTCPVCGKAEWKKSSDLAQLMMYFPDRLTTGVLHVPLITVTCVRCCHTLLFDAAQMGVV